MFNIQNKYTSYGVYRFMDNEAQVIYIGKANNIHNRLFNQHFSSKGSNVNKKAYHETAKLEIIKLNDPGETAGMELYLIDKYRPKYNKQDKRKNISKLHFEQKDYYENKEKWELYYTFREYDFDKIKLTKKQNQLSIIIAIIVFILIILYSINTLL